MIFKDELT